MKVKLHPLVLIKNSKGFSLINKFVKENQYGFTLIELLVTITIIGVLSAVIITAAGAAQRQSRDGQRKSDLDKIQTALQHYYTDQGFYPAATFDLSTATEITNCTTIGSCTVSKTYLIDMPKAPTSPNYCYNAYNNSSKATGCDNTSSTLTNHCHFYSLYAKLEVGPSSSLTCGAGLYNFELNPS